MRSASGMLLAISLTCLAAGVGMAAAGEVGANHSGNSGQARQGAGDGGPCARARPGGLRGALDRSGRARLGRIGCVGWS